MTYVVSAASWKFDADNAVIDQTPSSDASLEVAPAGTRLVLSAFSAGYSSKTNTLVATSAFDELPRVYFRDAAASPVVKFAVVAERTTGMANLATQTGVKLITIPGHGVLFENGLSISVQADSPGNYKQSITLNILYQV